VCSSIDGPARMTSITTGMKEEQQIRVMTKFVVDRGSRTRVEGDRTRVGEVLVCFDWVGCPQLAVTPCIYRMGRSCPSRTHQIYLWKFKLDQICSNRPDWCESVQNSRNF
jgi:hypothetical protein